MSRGGPVGLKDNCLLQVHMSRAVLGLEVGDLAKDDSVVDAVGSLNRERGRFGYLRGSTILQSGIKLRIFSTSSAYQDPRDGSKLPRLIYFHAD